MACAGVGTGWDERLVRDKEFYHRIEWGIDCPHPDPLPDAALGEGDK
jgi:hypothetical protein